MKKVILIVVVIILSAGISACGIKGIKEWASNKLIVEVHNVSGLPILKALVESSEDQQVETNEQGIASLYYQKSGLKVITISADKYETKQIRANMPKDNARVVNVILSPKS